MHRGRHNTRPSQSNTGNHLFGSFQVHCTTQLSLIWARREEGRATPACLVGPVSCRDTPEKVHFIPHCPLESSTRKGLADVLPCEVPTPLYRDGRYRDRDARGKNARRASYSTRTESATLERRAAAEARVWAASGPGRERK